MITIVVARPIAKCEYKQVLDWGKAHLFTGDLVVVETGKRRARNYNW